MDVYQDYRVFQEIFVLLEDGDRQMLRAFNLSTLQYHALLLLDATEGWRLTDLSERLLCERSTVTRLVDFLEGEGLVSRVADPEDRRSQRVALTEAGVALRAQARTALEHSLQQRFSSLNTTEQQQLSLLHEKLLHGLYAQKERSHREGEGK